MNSKAEISLSHRVSLIYFIIVGILIFITSSPLIIPFGILGKKFDFFLRLHHYVLNKTAYIFLALIPFKNKKINLTNFNQFKKTPILLVSNHRSYLDMFIFLAYINKLRSLANFRVFKIPILGFIMRLSKQLEFEPGNFKLLGRSLEESKKGMKKGDRVLMFPEMTRSPLNFKGMAKFHLTSFKLAKELNAYVCPVVLKGTDKIWPKGSFAMDFNEPLEYKALTPIYSGAFNKSEDLSKFVYQKMLNELES